MAKSSLREIPWFRGILASPGSRTDLERASCTFQRGLQEKGRRPWRLFPASSIRIAVQGKQKKVQSSQTPQLFLFCKNAEKLTKTGGSLRW